MGRLSYHLHAAARGGCRPHNKVICPSLALAPPLDAGQPAPLPVMHQQPLQDNHVLAAAVMVGWDAGVESWEEGAIPTEKAFV